MEIHVTDVGRTVDGTYEFDWLSLNAREKHEIKLISGVRPTEYQEALVTSDAAFVAAVALIALRRGDVFVGIDLLLDTQGMIRFVFPELEAGEGGPPARGRRGSKSSATDASGPSSEAS